MDNTTNFSLFFLITSYILLRWGSQLPFVDRATKYVDPKRLLFYGLCVICMIKIGNLWQKPPELPKVDPVVKTVKRSS